MNEKIRITDTSGEITAESINGAITMTGIDSKSVDASTVNGNIIYEGKLADGGRYSFGTHNGDLLLGVPENANATFTIRTYQGSFSTDLPLAGRQPRRHPARPPRGDDARQRQRGREPGNLRGIDPGPARDRRPVRAGGSRATSARRRRAPTGGGRHPSLGAQRFLQALRPLDQGVRVLELLDFLPAIRKCNDKFVIVTVGLATDFVKQPRVLALEKPDHAACLSVYERPSLNA